MIVRRIAVLAVVMSACGGEKIPPDRQAKVQPGGEAAPTTTAPQPPPPPAEAAAYGTTPAEHVTAICKKLTDCSCPAAAACEGSFKQIEDVVPEAMWTCLGGYLARDCAAVCAPDAGNDCVQASAVELKANLDKRVAAASGTPAEITAKVKTLCDRQRSCGCKDADTCEQAVAPVQDAIPPSTWTCLENLSRDCGQYCDQQQLQGCLVADQVAIAENAKKLPALRVCRKLTACGCAPADCDGMYSQYLHSAPAIDYMTCQAQLDCEGACGNSQDQRSKLYQTCMVPVQQALRHRAHVIKTVHQMQQSAIRGMPGRTPVQVYSPNGTYLYTTYH